MTVNVSALPTGSGSAGPRTLEESILRHLCYSLGKDPEHASRYDWRVALSLALRDTVVDVWFASTRRTPAPGAPTKISASASITSPWSF